MQELKKHIPLNPNSTETVKEERVWTPQKEVSEYTSIILCDPVDLTQFSIRTETEHTIVTRHYKNHVETDIRQFIFKLNNGNLYTGFDGGLDFCITRIKVLRSYLKDLVEPIDELKIVYKAALDYYRNILKSDDYYLNGLDRYMKNKDSEYDRGDLNFAEYIQSKIDKFDGKHN